MDVTMWKKYLFIAVEVYEEINRWCYFSEHMSYKNGGNHTYVFTQYLSHRQNVTQISQAERHKLLMAWLHETKIKKGLVHANCRHVHDWWGTVLAAAGLVRAWWNSIQFSTRVDYRKSFTQFLLDSNTVLLFE